MEENLDKIAGGECTPEDVLSGFYGDFSKTLERAQSTISESKVKIPDEESDIICEKCGRKMVIKHGKFGSFAACPGYPECKFTKPIVNDTGAKCPVCGETVPFNFEYCQCTKLEVRSISEDFCEHCGADYDNCSCGDNNEIYLEHITAPYIYTGIIRSKILSFKFRNEKKLAKDFAFAFLFQLRRPLIEYYLGLWLIRL